MEIRGSRVQSEPSLTEDHVTVSIRHKILHVGNKTRLFRIGAYMSEVYDWIGSLNTVPEHFNLLDYRMKIVPPHLKVFSGIFNMVETDEPVLMSPAGEIAFAGFGTAALDTSINYSYSDTSTSNDYSRQQYDMLNDLRLLQLAKMTKHSMYEVDRETIYDDMLKIFETNDGNCSFQFKNGDAVGDGVTRDAFSSFFKELIAHNFQGESECVLLVSVDSLETAGKIITTAFITKNIFPSQICHSSLMASLFNEVTDDELFTSYLNYLPEREAEIILACKDGKYVNKQAIIDILSESNIFTAPSPVNIKELCCRAATISLIRCPSFGLQSLIQGMGPFWKDVTKEMFQCYLREVTPTYQSVIECLDPKETCPVDQKITTWVHRYLRTCSNKDVTTFVHFVTGSSLLPPGDKIQLQYVNQPEQHLHPRAATCFKILILPRQYSCFTLFRDNLKLHLNSVHWHIHDDDSTTLPDLMD